MRKFFRRDKQSIGSFIINHEEEGNKVIKQAENDHAFTLKLYANGNYSGHPEEILEQIETTREFIKKTQAAKTRGWVPDPEIISMYESKFEYFKANSNPEENPYYDGICASYEKDIALAKKGYL